MQEVEEMGRRRLGCGNRVAGWGFEGEGWDFYIVDSVECSNPGYRRWDGGCFEEVGCMYDKR